MYHFWTSASRLICVDLHLWMNLLVLHFACNLLMFQWLLWMIKLKADPPYQMTPTWIRFFLLVKVLYYQLLRYMMGHFLNSVSSLSLFMAEIFTIFIFCLTFLTVPIPQFDEFWCCKRTNLLVCYFLFFIIFLRNIKNLFNMQPVDYEPPFFRSCTEEEAHILWNKNPLKMEVGNVNSKHLILALKVRSELCINSNVPSSKFRFPLIVQPLV